MLYVGLLKERFEIECSYLSEYFLFLDYFWIVFCVSLKFCG